MDATVLRERDVRGDRSLGRIGWVGVALGTVAALVMGRFLIRASPNFYGMIAYEDGPGRTTVLSGESQTAADAVSVLAWVVCWALAYFLGGLVAGRLAHSSGGLNGALTTVCGGIFGIVSFFVVVGPNAGGDPEGQALAELHAVVFAFVFFPVTVVASYFGGKVGGRQRTGSTTRALE